MWAKPLAVIVAFAITLSGCVAEDAHPRATAPVAATVDGTDAADDATDAPDDATDARSDEEDPPPASPSAGPDAEADEPAPEANETDASRDASPVEEQGAPTARVNASADHVLLGDSVRLDGRHSSDPNDDALDYGWDLGDGATATGATVQHTYGSEGSYKVRLTVTDPAGATSTATHTITVDATKYEQSVWIAWGKTDLDVLILGVEDPVIGAAIHDAIEAWELGIADMAPALAEDLQVRVHWPGADGAPPAGFQPDIYFVPQGFMAITNGNSCIATAPLSHEAALSGPNAQYRVAAHEFGHCLGLGHIFKDGIEYEPAFDIMGGGRAERACPSNLNIHVLESVFYGGQDAFAMPASGYVQSDC